MDEIQDLKKKVDHLEYDVISPMKDEINDIKITLSNNDLLTKQAVESNKKLTETMDILKSTMLEVAQSVKDSNKVTGQLADTVEDLSKKVSSVENNTKKSIDEFSIKLDSIDDKGKIDIVDWMKDNWFKLTLLIGFGSYLIANAMGVKIF